MSTNATIRLKRKDGTETGIYLHWDGYTEHTGVILQLAYNTADKVEKLLALGDLSSIGYYTEPKQDSEHTFNHPQQCVCVAYHRDRGEEYRQSNGKNEFVYTFDEAEAVWFVETYNFVGNTEATKKLCIDFFETPTKQLLLDAILATDIDTHWDDDEFAMAGDVKTQCTRKAVEARQKIIEDNAEIERAYYEAYYN